MTNLADEDHLAAVIRDAVDSIELRGPGPDLAAVHVGARRRRRRRLAATAAGAVAFTVAGTLAVSAAWPGGLQAVVPALAPDEPVPSVPISSLAPNERPVVDAATGVLLSPLERYGVSSAEGHEIDFARDLLIAECVADRGLVWKPVDLRSQNNISGLYGIWTMDQATTLGYGVPPTSEAETEALAIPPSDELDDAAMSCVRSLKTAPSSVLGKLATPQLDNPWPGAYGAAESSEEWRAAVGDWEACLETAGIQPPTDGWMPPAAKTADRQTELKIAVQDVTCKEQTGLVQRLADLEASYEAVFIRAHEAELTQLRRQIDATVTLARQVIAEHGG